MLIITVLGEINSNLTFIFDLNYFLWKLKTLKRQGVSSLLETKHKVFRLKTKPIPRMSVRAAKIRHQCSTYSRIGDRLVVISEPRKI